MDTLSIDFGTSFCTASYLDAAGSPCPVCFGYNQYNAKCYKIPTVIQYALSPSGEECKIIGESALYNLVQSNQLNPSIIAKIKTELRERSGYIINGRPKKSSAIVADILAHIKGVAEGCAGREFKHLMLTHPAQYAALKVDLLRTAAFQSGFSEISLLEEPKAAAYAFIQKHNITGHKGAIVFDYGGGTIDIAYLWIEGSNDIQFKFKPYGKEQCGGEYIDLEMHNHFFKYFYPNSPAQISPILLEHCNRLKINFGVKDIQHLVLNGKAVTISRSDFEKIISPKVSVATSLLKDVVNICKQSDFPIDYVFLNGGSSRLRVINETIKALIPDAELMQYEDDDIAVAIGALLFLKPNAADTHSENDASTPKGRVVCYDSSLTKIIERFKKS